MLAMAGSIAAAIAWGDASYVARAGALVTLAGILMTTRRLLTSSAEKQSFLWPEARRETSTDDLDLERASQQEIEHLKAEKCGFWFLIAGTVIWGYGDVVFGLFQFK